MAFSGYLALGTGSVSFTEMTGTGYARQAITFANTQRLTNNSTAATFTATSTDWGSATQYAYYAASSGGLPLFWWAKTIPLTVANGTSFVVPINRFNLSFAGSFYAPGLVSLWNVGDQVGIDGGNNVITVGTEFSASKGAIGVNKQLPLGSRIGAIIGANMNVTTDQSFSMLVSGSFVIRKITATNASISLTTAVGGVYPSASKAGTAIVANTQVYSALSTSALYVDLTLASITNSTVYSAAPIFSLTTAQGATATADLFLYGDIVA